MLDEVGLQGDRIKMFNIGASDAPLFAQAANEMTDKARELGPNPLKKGIKV